MISNTKSCLIALFWLVCGFLSRLLAGYLFSFGTSNLLEPTSKFMGSILHLNLRAGFIAFILFHITDLIIVFSIAFLLARATQKRKLWFFAFIFGVIGPPLYDTISYNIAVKNYYGPYTEDTAQLVRAVIGTVIADLIITPLVAWLGVTLGNHFRQRIRANQHDIGRL
jgi:uncharacterized membrane protein YeaQ/YmgE (transglycosylase-associated protein family)